MSDKDGSLGQDVWVLEKLIKLWMKSILNTHKQIHEWCFLLTFYDWVVSESNKIQPNHGEPRDDNGQSKF